MLQSQTGVLFYGIFYCVYSQYFIRRIHFRIISGEKKLEIKVYLVILLIKLQPIFYFFCIATAYVFNFSCLMLAVFFKSRSDMEFCMNKVIFMHLGIQKQNVLTCGLLIYLVVQIIFLILITEGHNTFYIVTLFNELYRCSDGMDAKKRSLKSPNRGLLVEETSTSVQKVNSRFRKDTQVPAVSVAHWQCVTAHMGSLHSL